MKDSNLINKDINFIYDENNIFFKIITGKLPAKKIYEDEKLLIFHDIHPIDDIHLLVIPKNKFINFTHFISEASQEDILHFFNKINDITKEKNIKNYKLLTNNGKLAGQVIEHFHFHIIAHNESFAR